MAIMSLYAGRKIIKKYEVEFWYTPKTLKALIWKPNSLILVKKFYVRDKSYQRLKDRVAKWMEKSD